MIAVTLNAFSFVRAKLAALGVDHDEARHEVPGDITVAGFLAGLGMKQGDVEAVFLNGKVVPQNTPLRDGDRLALVPPGTPGPYRVLLGMAKPGRDPDATS